MKTVQRVIYLIWTSYFVDAFVRVCFLKMLSGDNFKWVMPLHVIRSNNSTSKRSIILSSSWGLLGRGFKHCLFFPLYTLRNGPMGASSTNWKHIGRPCIYHPGYIPVTHQGWRLTFLCESKGPRPPNATFSPKKALRLGMMTTTPWVSLDSGIPIEADGEFDRSLLARTLGN